MSDQKSGPNRRSVRIGLMSRIDFGSKGWRTGLLHLAAQRFREEDVDYVVLVGGLVAGRAITARKKQMKKEHALRTRLLNRLEKQIAVLQRLLTKYKKSKMTLAMQSRVKKLRQKFEALDKDREAQRSSLRSIERQQKGMLPENMAMELAKKLPVFTNARNETVKLYILPSPAYDGQDGIDTARLLVESNFDQGLRLLKPGADRQQLHLPHSRSYFAEIELLAPLRPPWRGDYFSTPVDRLIRDKRKQTSLATTPNITVVGGFGSTITKPKGEAKVPYVAIPVLHRIEDEEKPTSENQIGVLIMEVFPKVVVPLVKSHPFKDFISHERNYIEAPNDLKVNQERCIKLIQAHGLRGTTWLADNANLSREQVQNLLQPLVVRHGSRPRKSWPGLIYDAPSDSWDFNFPWVLDHLRYPAVTGQRKIDSFVGFGCLHAGSHDTDYEHFLREVPQVILEQNAASLIGAGDFVEGLAHGMMVRQETVNGSNETDHETLAARMVAQVMFNAFTPRFEAMVAGRDLTAMTRLETAELVRDCLVTFDYIPGNHDTWTKYEGHDPLARMVDQMTIRLSRVIERFLIDKGLRVDFLIDLVASKIVTTADQRFALPSGLRMSLQHPYMARAKTTSLRPQEMLDFAPDCPVVVGANFHVGETIEVWEPDLGQRLCVQIGTMKHGSPFEGGKLKTVDQGFVSGRIESIDGRIVRTENTTHSNEGVIKKRLDPKQPMNDFGQEIGLTV